VLPVPRDVTSLLRSLVDADPTTPRLTAYGEDGERIELSARVLDNWVAKTANLLVEELDAGPGTRVAVDLPVHWRTVVWALATWSAGAELAPVGERAPVAPDADVVVTDRPDRYAASLPAASSLVAVALPGLAMRYPGDLPGRALDYARVVAGFGDVFVPPVPVDAAAAALSGADGATPHGRLLPAAAERAARAGWGPAPRVLLRGRTPADLPVAALAVYAARGSVVLCVASAAEDVRRVADAERVDTVEDGR
jgi:uncharacterized protein (TIGR03089 family)